MTPADQRQLRRDLIAEKIAAHKRFSIVVRVIGVAAAIGIGWWFQTWWGLLVPVAAHFIVSRHRWSTQVFIEAMLIAEEYAETRA